MLFKAAELTIQRFLTEGTSNILSTSTLIKAIPFINPIVKKEGFSSVPDIKFEDIGAL